MGQPCWQLVVFLQALTPHLKPAIFNFLILMAWIKCRLFSQLNIENTFNSSGSSFLNRQILNIAGVCIYCHYILSNATPWINV